MVPREYDPQISADDVCFVLPWAGPGSRKRLFLGTSSKMKSHSPVRTAFRATALKIHRLEVAKTAAGPEFSGIEVLLKRSLDDRRTNHQRGLTAGRVFANS